MNTDLWVEIYVKLIKAGRKTLADVPEQYYEKVKSEIEKWQIETEHLI